MQETRRPGFDPWVGKIPWRREWQPTPIFLAWRIPWTEKPGGLQFMGSQRVRHNWAQACTHTHMSNSVYVLSTQIIHRKQTRNKTFLILQCSTLKNTVVKYSSWPTGAGIQWREKQSCCLEGVENVGDGRAEGSSATGHGVQAASCLMLRHKFWFLERFNSIWTLEKTIQWCLGGSSLFLVIGDAIGLDPFWIHKGCCSLHVMFCVWVLFSKTRNASSDKDPVTCFDSSVTFSSSCLSSSSPWASSSIRSY